MRAKPINQGAFAPLDFSDMKDPYGPSKFWQDINNNHLSEENLKRFFKDFRSRDINFKLAYWNPHNNGVRYFKELIHNLVAELSPVQLKKISRVRASELGEPLSVTKNGLKISMDNLLALYETEFISKKFNFKGAHILEIGAGYGRTAHFIMTNYDIGSYSIIDLDRSISLSKKYLGIVLPESAFETIEFIPVEDIPSIESSTFDICINMNSFAEMDRRVVRHYLTYIDKHASYFYTRNPVGKYLDKNLDNHFRGSRVVKETLNLGILNDIIDIYDDKAIQKQSVKFLKAYLPGKNWSVLDSGWAKPWSLYWQSIYKRHARYEGRRGARKSLSFTKIALRGDRL